MFESAGFFSGMMRIHCLGGGLVGSFVTRKLVEANFEVHLYDIIHRDTDAIFHLESALDSDHSEHHFWQKPSFQMLRLSLQHILTQTFPGRGKFTNLQLQQSHPQTATQATTSHMGNS